MHVHAKPLLTSGAADLQSVTQIRTTTLTGNDSGHMSQPSIANTYASPINVNTAANDRRFATLAEAI